MDIFYLWILLFINFILSLTKKKKIVVAVVQYESLIRHIHNQK